MSLFNQYESDEEDEINELPLDINYDKKLSINKITESPYSISEEEEEEISKSFKVNQDEPPTPTLYSPPLVTNLPLSTNPNFKGLYPNVHSPIVNSEDIDQPIVDQVIKEKIMKYHQMKQQGINFNETLRKSIAFNNPSILEKLISFCEIKENGSNMFPKSVEPDEYYDQLEKRQRQMEEDKFKLKLDKEKEIHQNQNNQQTNKKYNKWEKKHLGKGIIQSKTSTTTTTNQGGVITSAPSINKQNSTKRENEQQNNNTTQINSIFKKFKK